jgi:hypothetical protein
VKNIFSRVGGGFQNHDLQIFDAVTSSSNDKDVKKLVF